MGRQEEEHGDREQRVIYGVDNPPSLLGCSVYGVQQAIRCLSGTLALPFILAPLLCAGSRDDVRAKLMSITLFMSGVATLLQTTFGVRLPIIQGGSHAFVPPIIAMMSLNTFVCGDTESVMSVNTTIGLSGNETSEDDWMMRMREIQGNLMLASLTQVIFGCTGLMGFLLRVIGPLTIAPTISLIGLSLTSVITDFCHYQWGIAVLTTALTVLFSVIIHNVKVPLPAYSRSHGCHLIRYPLFQLLSVILPICIAWFVSFILTEADVLTTNSTLPEYHARTDYKINILESAPWFYFPYPFQFGIPTVSAAGYFGMLAATLSSIVESVGDYFAAARISNVAPPPPHAINRGIAVEGFASIISGLVGAGHGTTSYSENIGAIALTKVASRRVFQAAGIILVVCGIVGKFGAVLALIPDPVIGGSLLLGLGLVVSIGISVLQFVDLSSMRNLTIIALSFTVGLMLPQWLSVKPDAIDTGVTELDQVLRVLLGTASFVGGMLGFILDNIITGTLEERGIWAWRQRLVGHQPDVGGDSTDTYEFPYVTKYIRRVKCCFYNPVSPTFEKQLHCCTCCKHGRKWAPESYVYEQDSVKEPDFHTDVLQTQGRKKSRLNESSVGTDTTLNTYM